MHQTTRYQLGKGAPQDYPIVGCRAALFLRNLAVDQDFARAVRSSWRLAASGIGRLAAVLSPVTG